MERRLAAILVADVVGYSRLMEADESGTLARLKTLRRELVQPMITERNGRIVKLMGDGLLAEFSSVVDAVQCAVAIQQSMHVREVGLPDEERIRLRIGVNLGDVIVEGSDIYGDGVNIAARIEALADSGGVSISGSAYEQVRKHMDHPVIDTGEHTVKNISAPLRVYAINHWLAGAAPDSKDGTPERNSRLATKPRIAIAPLQVVDGNQKLNALAEGLRHGITEGLSKSAGVTVTKSSNQNDIFLLEGMVRNFGELVRLTFTLTDESSGAQVWAERYDRTLDNMLTIEDEVSQTVVWNVRICVKKSEHAHLEASDDAELSASDLLTKAAGFLTQGHKYSTQAKNAVALALLEMPDSSMAHSMMTVSLFHEAEYSPIALTAAEFAEIETHAETGVKLPQAAYFEHQIKAIIQADLRQDFAGAKFHAEIALQHNPQLVPASAIVAVVECYLGSLPSGLEYLRQVIAANQQDPNRFRYRRDLALALLLSGPEDEAVNIMRRVAAEAPELRRNDLILAAALSLADDTDAAHQTLKSLIAKWPSLSVQTMRPTSIGDPDLSERFVQALINAGLPV